MELGGGDGFALRLERLCCPDLARRLGAVTAARDGQRQCPLDVADIRHHQCHSPGTHERSAPQRHEHEDGPGQVVTEIAGLQQARLQARDPDQPVHESIVSRLGAVPSDVVESIFLELVVDPR